MGARGLGGWGRVGEEGVGDEGELKIPIRSAEIRLKVRRGRTGTAPSDDKFNFNTRLVNHCTFIERAVICTAFTASYASLELRRNDSHFGPDFKILDFQYSPNRLESRNDFRF